MNTREKILDESLTLFSKKGFDAVSVRDIAKAVGIKESSLYNHFKSKQDIFDCIISEYSSRVNSFFRNINVIDEKAGFTVDERTVNMYKNTTTEQFEAIVLIIFEHYFCDDNIIKFRKMLTIEQYRSPELTKLFRVHSFEGSLEYQSQLFAALIREGCFIETDPYLLALEFFSPIFLIFYKFDNDKESMAEAKALFIRHVRHFNQIYGKRI